MVVPSSYRATLSPVCTTPFTMRTLPVASFAGGDSGRMMIPLGCCTMPCTQPSTVAGLAQSA